mmetsp:Transcript_27957/g.60145  ORF Transcript_27957/g.60145 Transcript_27957/m.60145 type:complete len:98 (-) Transcript_27957:541-834(-)|eukprot:CAMPEP_0168169544 /NCGR_PEP_ID=MMETSP0139_2-20121125/3697_1 /TAXON_ID=44445 /ORGANISM="Pseudo-nitzschia australis, Strain 10249 10 AB" /LENGTH=97 /DNA_ID=CAMNT_0008086975 /DNA_START=543 /DNA_END=836 /DNA_ORIENTATION=+
MMTFAHDDLKHTIATDLSGRYPTTSTREHKYIFLMFDFDSNYIHAVPIKSQKAKALMKGFNKCFQVLKNNGFQANIVRLDNEVSQKPITYITNQQLD